MKTITSAIAYGLVLVRSQSLAKKASITTINKTLGLMRLATKISKKPLDRPAKCDKL